MGRFWLFAVASPVLLWLAFAVVRGALARGSFGAIARRTLAAGVFVVALGLAVVGITAAYLASGAPLARPIAGPIVGHSAETFEVQTSTGLVRLEPTGRLDAACHEGARLVKPAWSNLATCDGVPVNLWSTQVLWVLAIVIVGAGAVLVVRGDRRR